MGLKEWYRKNQEKQEIRKQKAWGAWEDTKQSTQDMKDHWNEEKQRFQEERAEQKQERAKELNAQQPEKAQANTDWKHEACPNCAEAVKRPRLDRVIWFLLGGLIFFFGPIILGGFAPVLGGGLLIWQFIAMKNDKAECGHCGHTWYPRKKDKKA